MHRNRSYQSFIVSILYIRSSQYKSDYGFISQCKIRMLTLNQQLQKLIITINMYEMKLHLVNLSHSELNINF